MEAHLFHLKKMNLNDNRLTGIARINEISTFMEDKKEMAVATYAWYKKFDVPFSFEDIE